jgi:hypothetical protein
VRHATSDDRALATLTLRDHTVVMRWLALLLSIAIPAVAAADSPCVTTDVLPFRGSVVPMNARLWTEHAAPWSYTLVHEDSRQAVEPIAYSARHAPAIVLEPAFEHAGSFALLDDKQRPLTSFVVAELHDVDAPEPPGMFLQDDRVHLVVDHDTAIVRIEVGKNPERASTMLLLDRRGDRGDCVLDTNFSTSLCVHATAIDLAGNESEAVHHCALRGDVIPVALVTAPVPPIQHGPNAVVVIAFVVAIVIGFFLVFAPEIDMGWLRRRSSGDELLPAAARQVACTACHNAVTRSFGVVAGGTGAIVFASATLAAFVALGAVLLLARQIWVYGRARRMLLLLDRHSAGAAFGEAEPCDGEPTVTLHGDHLLRVRSRGDFSWLVCSQRQLATATERVLPLARLR